jgi:hypothetical protein
MAQEDGVPLERRFSLSPRSAQESDSQEIARASGLAKPVGWPEIEQNHRCVILAEAGAGKTFEMTARAKQAAAEGRRAFFIRIEDIEEGFDTAFEIGSADDFDLWLNGTGEAWFYLDSIDEARLSDTRRFEKAIRRFGRRIQPAQQRARIILSSRPYAWRAKSDRALVEDVLPFTAPKSEETAASAAQDSGLRVYLLDPLDDNDIRRFAHHRDTPEIDRLITELQRAGLTSLAERPFDLELVLRKWRDGRALDGRLSLLQYNIDERLKEKKTANDLRQQLNLEKARQGARALAAAVVLTGEAGIQVPDESPDRTGLDAEIVLADWKPADVHRLLERGLFNDPLYGMVRFRHREIRELLAAEWFRDLLRIDGVRHRIETLFFREQYGHQVITPRLRPVLTWLILFDAEMRHKAMKIAPEVAIEGGDPACLPLAERRALLRGIVGRIARNQNGRSTWDISTVARIARTDLTSEVLQLIDDHHDNDEAILFLSQMVWQGGMTPCVPVLSGIATDPTRDLWVRAEAAEAVMTCGDREQKDELWMTLNAAPVPLPHRLLAEIVRASVPDINTVTLLLTSLDKLKNHDDYILNYLTRSLHHFINRSPVRHSSDDAEPLALLVHDLNARFDQPPFVDQRECRISQEFAWLLPVAIHTIERLISIRSPAALSMDALAIILKLPLMRYFVGMRYDDYKSRLAELVPAWKALNDALFWKHVEEKRASLESTKGVRLTNDRQLYDRRHDWRFETERFQDVLAFIPARPDLDDKLVACSLAYRLFVEAGKPDTWLHDLQQATGGHPALAARLDALMAPVDTAADDAWEREDAERKERRRLKKEQDENNLTERIKYIKSNPNIIRNPPGLNPGDMSTDQYYLFKLISESQISDTDTHGTNWKVLIPGFGEDVAHAYRDAAIAQWRNYTPALRSEGADTGSTPYALVFGMAGLNIEAREEENFPAHLSEAEIIHALRYSVWELNGFPDWLERINNHRPDLVLNAIIREVHWELVHAEADKSLHYVVHDLAYYAPWLHTSVAPAIYAWLEQNDVRHQDTFLQCLQIVLNGGIGKGEISRLARSKAVPGSGTCHLATWYALWIDVDAVDAIPAAEEWLSNLPSEEASHEAQLLVTRLMGTDHPSHHSFEHGDFRKVPHLKSLYILGHRHVRTEDDIERAGKGSYAPVLRDHAQDAREALIRELSAIPGKEAYLALRDLARNHPNPRYRKWIATLADDRTLQDADLTPWCAKQVSEFGRTCTLTPTTHRELYDVTLDVLMDLKAWLEGGNDSPYQTWKRVENETEMRNLIAGALNGRAQGRFTCAQENEQANGQRTDIWMQTPQVQSPVPIELKILDNDWSGPALCERLRNQLVGGYLREHTAGCGVFLLVWRGAATRRNWQIAGRRVALPDLADALRDYWQTIADEHPGVDAIEVMVIDLTVRGATSAT